MNIRCLFDGSGYAAFRRSASSLPLVSPVSGQSDLGQTVLHQTVLGEAVLREAIGEVPSLLKTVMPVGAFFIIESGLILIDLYLLGPKSIIAASAVAISAEIYYCLVAGFGAFIAVAAFDFAYGVGRKLPQLCIISLRNGLVHATLFGGVSVIWGLYTPIAFAFFGLDAEFVDFSRDYMAVLAWTGLPFILVIFLQRLSVALKRQHILYVAGFGGLAVKIAVGVWLVELAGEKAGAQASILASEQLTQMVQAVAYANLAAALAMLAFMTYRLRDVLAQAWSGRVVRQQAKAEDRGSILQFWRVGLPLGVAMFLDYAQASAVLTIFAWLSPVESAAAVIAVTVSHFMIVLLYALSETAAIGLSNRIGTGDLKGQANYKVASALVLAAIAVMGSGVLFVFGGDLARLVLGLQTNSATGDQAGVLLLTAVYLKMVCLLVLFEAANSYFTLVLKANGDTRLIVIERVVSTWLVSFLGVYLGVVYFGANGTQAWLVVCLSGLAGTSVYLINELLFSSSSNNTRNRRTEGSAEPAVRAARLAAPPRHEKAKARQ